VTLGEHGRCLLAPKEVARRLGVSVSMVYKLLRIGELRPIYIGRLPRIAETDLDAYLGRARVVRP
jgi:excisionase family DNA binding protein